MVVLILYNCPPKIKGDVTKWLFEINTGIYIGNINTKSRDLLWERIINNIDYGTATMIFSSNNEQGFEFKTHNSKWKICNFDGLKFMLRPKTNSNKPELQNYVVLYIEFINSNPSCEYIKKVQIKKFKNGFLSEEIMKIYKYDLTKDDLITILMFIENQTIIGYNVSLMINILISKCFKYSIDIPKFKTIDILTLAKRTLTDINDYELNTLIQYFESINDSFQKKEDMCSIINDIYCKL